MVLRKGNTGGTGNETSHLRNTMLNHSGVFACHVRFLLRGGEDSEVGKLVGFYQMGLAVFHEAFLLVYSLLNIQRDFGAG